MESAISTSASEPAKAPHASKRGGPLGALRRATLAHYLDTSLATLDRWDAGGRVPTATRIGGVKFWPLKTIDLWISFGCPDRATFDDIIGSQRTAK